ncbi:MAG: D-3-phosphoglycerate dehydrogenase [Ulvibacter sp.]|jgi:D-3-phosphoglycerate dehydrogenase
METRTAKIVVAEPNRFSPLGLQKLQLIGTVVLGPFSYNELKSICKDADILILRLQHYIDSQFIQSSKKLKYIVTPTTGLNHIDMEAASLENIDIISLKGETEFLKTIPSTSEHTWGLILALVRHIPQANKDVMNGIWNRDAFIGRNLTNLKLGILGFGRVGQQIAKYADAFDMSYTFYDIDNALNNLSNQTEDLTSFLSSIDVLTLHIPLNKKTRHFLDAEKLSKLKKGSLVINTSRGEIIDEDSLVDMLVDGHIGGAAVDVLDQELIKETREKSPLLKYARTNKNVIITPHIAGATIDSMQRTEEFVIKKLLYKWG